VNLKQLKRLAESATPGSWEFERVSHHEGLFSYEIIERDRFISIHESDYKKYMKAKFDADYISAFNPATCLKILEALEVYREALEFYSKGGNPSRDVWEDKELGFFTGKRSREALSRVSEILGGDK
jgi:hypothetical protein